MHRSPSSNLAGASTGEGLGLAKNPILIYDGSCGFCMRAAMWLSRHSTNNSIDLRTSQEMNADQLAALGLTQGLASASIWWIDRHGPLSGHAAISAALRNCQRGWRQLGQLIDIAPFRWIGPPIYRQVARNRHLLPGATPACRVDAPRVDDIEENVERT